MISSAVLTDSVEPVTIGLVEKADVAAEVSKPAARPASSTAAAASDSLAMWPPGSRAFFPASGSAVTRMATKTSIFEGD